MFWQKEPIFAEDSTNFYLTSYVGLDVGYFQGFDGRADGRG